MFISLFLLFMRFLPMITIFEVKAVKPEADPHHEPDHSHGEKAAHPKEAAVH